MDVIRINGKDKEFSTGLPKTLSELLKQLGVDTATVIAEVDGRIVQRAEFGETEIRAGQNIELVRFVAGG